MAGFEAGSSCARDTPHSDTPKMSSHDEYSSDEEDLFDDGSYVTLGLTDVSIAESDDVPTIEDTFMGGQPVWLHPNSKPEPKDLKCGNCQKDMALLLQAFAPFPDQLYDRVIYIFACKDTRSCSRKKGSVKAIRGLCKDPAKIADIGQQQENEARELLEEKLKLEEKKKLQIEMTKDLFDSSKPSADSTNPFGGNPFGGNPFGSSASGESSNPFGKTQESKATSKDQGQGPQSKTYASVCEPAASEVAKKDEISLPSTLPEYPGYFIFTEPEKFKKVTLEPELEKYKDMIEKAEQTDSKKERSMSSSSGTSASAALNPENSKIAGMLNDKHFENFSNVVGHNPSQVLRYNLGGKPLLYNGTDDVAKAFSTGTIPDPAYNPSSSRQFELQLMPKAIIDLENDSYDSVADILGGMSWGTITVATDTSDQIPALDENHVGYVAEYCGVQWEESV